MPLHMICRVTKTHLRQEVSSGRHDDKVNLIGAIISKSGLNTAAQIQSKYRDGEEKTHTDAWQNVFIGQPDLNLLQPT